MADEKLKRTLQGFHDSRSNRGIFARGNARYLGPGKAPKPGNLMNVQKAARKRLKKMNDMRRVGR